MSDIFWTNECMKEELILQFLFHLFFPLGFWACICPKTKSIIIVLFLFFPLPFIWLNQRLFSPLNSNKNYYNMFWLATFTINLSFFKSLSTKETHFGYLLHIEINKDWQALSRNFQNKNKMRDCGNGPSLFQSNVKKIDRNSFLFLSCLTNLKIYLSAI